MNGTVTLVGAGPGDVGLFTLKGKQALESAEVVVYDALVGQGVLALIPPSARCINVGKRASHHLVPQGEINQILLEEALAGRRVVRLKGGDPFLFGRGGEELELLAAHNIPFEVVPGVTSALAVPAYAGIPVTHRDCASSLHIITGHTKAVPEAQIDYSALVKLGGTFVFLMGLTALPQIMGGLLEAGIAPDLPAAALERGTTAHQRRVVSTVEHLARDAGEAKLKTPAIIVVGEVCALARQFHWAENRPLGGLRVVVTRPRGQASALTARLRERGAEVVELPAIATNAIWPNPALEQALVNSGRYGWLALTSPSGVKILFEQLKRLGVDIRALAGLKLAAVGAATAAALEEHGLIVALTPASYNAGELGTALARHAGKERVLILRARDGSPALTGALAAAETQFDDIPLYETVYTAENAEAVRTQLAGGEIDWAAFTSASTVRGFAAAMAGCGLGAVRALCIGAQTAAEAARLGMRVTTAPAATMESMVEALEAESRE